MIKSFAEFEAHFPKNTSKTLVTFVENVVLKHSRYIFTWRVARKQCGFCTHCQAEFVTVNPTTGRGLQHGKKSKCPKCKSECTIKASGMGRKSMCDYAALVWYEKSVIDPLSITARIIRVTRDYSGDFRTVQTHYNCRDMYLFEPGSSTYYRYSYSGWEKRKTVFSAFDSTLSDEHWLYRRKFHSIANIRRAVKNTSFQYSTWDRYMKYANENYVTDMTEFFDLAARYPCVEYLTKLGFEKLVWAMLYKNGTMKTINWRGKNIEKVLRLSKTDIQDIRRSGLSFGPQELKYYQDQKRLGNNIPATDAFVLAHLDDKYHQKDIAELEKLAPREKIFSYLLKQFRRRDERTGITQVFYDWKDYQRQCRELGMSLKEERYLFPNDLHDAHQKLTERIKLKNDKKMNDLIVKRMPELMQYEFEANGFSIRPIVTLQELFEEGKILNHCVGSYAKQYADGKTNIFAIRRKSDPDTPYYTVEFQGSSIRQCRGLKNCAMTPEVESLVKLWVSSKLLAKKRKRINSNGRSTEHRQEVLA